MNGEKHNKKVFKYNMSFYYQSTIIYFVAFILYLVIRGEFVEDSFTLITRDPIIYFFAIIVFVSVLTLLYNLYKNRHLEITSDGLAFINRFGERNFKFEDMIRVKISRRKRSALRLVRIKLKNRKRPLVIRPYDYENENELLENLMEIKNKIESDV
jgi:hypothetical protein